LVVSHPDVRLGPDESVVRYTLELNGPTGGTVFSTTTEIHCEESRTARAMCGVFGSVPGSG
jgi:hypothetical protein